MAKGPHAEHVVLDNEKKILGIQVSKNGLAVHLSSHPFDSCDFGIFGDGWLIKESRPITTYVCTRVIYMREQSLEPSTSTVLLISRSPT